MTETNKHAVTAALLVVVLFGACVSSSTPIGVPVNGKELAVKLPRGAEVQGHGRVDERTLFVAWSPQTGGGASTVLSVVDLQSKRRIDLCELGATGETAFAVSDSGVVAFNWREALYLIRARDLLAARDHPGDCVRFEQMLVQLPECRNCYEPEWIGPCQLRYRAFENDAWETKTLEVDPSVCR